MLIDEIIDNIKRSCNKNNGKAYIMPPNPIISKRLRTFMLMKDFAMDITKNIIIENTI